MSGFKVIPKLAREIEIANFSFKPLEKTNLKSSQQSTLFKNYLTTLPMTHFLVHLLIIQTTLFKHVNVSGIIINYKKWTTMKRHSVGYRSVRFWVSSMYIAQGSSDPTCLPACLLGFPYVWFWDEKLKNRKSLDGSEDSKYIVGSRTHCFLSDISAVAANRDIQGHTSKSAKHNRIFSHRLPFFTTQYSHGNTKESQWGSMLTILT